MKYYTGVGSRKTPKEILKVMRDLAIYLQNHGWTLRSGGAQGADSAFESGAGNLKEIYYANDANEAAMKIAGDLHPAWNRCGDYAKKLHGRNTFQVLGKDLKTPSTFLVCWTPEGCTSHATRVFGTGGTGTAISIADKYGIEVFNLQNIEHLNRIKRRIYAN